MRKDISKKTLLALAAKSGNQCAFPGCNHPLIDDNNLFVCQTCHIESPTEKGPRYTSETSDKYKSSYENLIILCYRHHKVIDTYTDKYPTVKLKEIKAEHENSQSNNFVIREDILNQIYNEANSFWQAINILNTEKHKHSDLSMKINTNIDISLAYENSMESFENIQYILNLLDEYLDKNWDSILDFLKTNKIDTEKLEAIKYYENPFYNPVWEYRKLGIPNWVQRFKLDQKTLAIKSLELETNLNPQNQSAQNLLAKLKDEMKNIADSVMHTD